MIDKEAYISVIDAIMKPPPDVDYKALFAPVVSMGIDQPHHELISLPFAAVLYDNLGALKALDEMGANLQLLLSGRSSLLGYAAYKKADDCIQWLVSSARYQVSSDDVQALICCGYDASALTLLPKVVEDADSKQQLNLLQIAVFKGSKSCFSAVYSASLPLNEDQKKQLFYQAVANGNAEFLHWMESEIEFPVTKNSALLKELMFQAIDCDQPEMLEDFIHHFFNGFRATVNHEYLQLRGGVSPLHHAVEKKSPRAVATLINYGASVFKRDDQGRNPYSLCPSPYDKGYSSLSESDKIVLEQIKNKLLSSKKEHYHDALRRLGGNFNFQPPLDMPLFDSFSQKDVSQSTTLLNEMIGLGHVSVVEWLLKVLERKDVRILYEGIHVNSALEAINRLPEDRPEKKTIANMVNHKINDSFPLHDAIKRRQAERLADLIKKEEWLNAEHPFAEKTTALAYALMLGEEEAIKILASHEKTKLLEISGAGFNACFSALMGRGDTATFDLLVAKGKIATMDSFLNGATVVDVLKLATREGNSKFFAHLLSHHIKEVSPSLNEYIAERGNEAILQAYDHYIAQRAPAHQLVKENKGEAFKRYCQENPDLHAFSTNDLGVTLMQQALIHGNDEVFSQVLALPLKSHDYGRVRTCLSEYIKSDTPPEQVHQRVMRLLQHHFPVDRDGYIDMSDLIPIAVARQNVALTMALLQDYRLQDLSSSGLVSENLPLLNKLPSVKEDLLAYAMRCQWSDENIGRLLEKYPSLIQSPHGLVNAMKQGRDALLKRMIETDRDEEVAAENWNISMALALVYDSKIFQEYLLTRKAEIEIDPQLMLLAAQFAPLPMVKSLEKMGAFLEVKDQNDAGLLHYACRSKTADSQEKLAYLVEEKKMDVNAPDEKGLTPIHNIARYGGGSDTLIAYLLEQKSNIFLKTESRTVADEMLGWLGTDSPGAKLIEEVKQAQGKVKKETKEKARKNPISGMNFDGSKAPDEFAAIFCEGEFDREAFAKHWQNIYRDHPSLRPQLDVMSVLATTQGEDNKTLLKAYMVDDATTEKIYPDTYDAVGVYMPGHRSVFVSAKHEDNQARDISEMAGTLIHEAKHRLQSYFEDYDRSGAFVPTFKKTREYMQSHSTADADIMEIRQICGQHISAYKIESFKKEFEVRIPQSIAIYGREKVEKALGKDAMEYFDRGVNIEVNFMRHHHAKTLLQDCVSHDAPIEYFADVLCKALERYGKAGYLYNANSPEATQLKQFGGFLKGELAGLEAVSPDDLVNAVSIFVSKEREKEPSATALTPQQVKQGVAFQTRGANP